MSGRVVRVLTSWLVEERLLPAPLLDAVTMKLIHAGPGFRALMTRRSPLKLCGAVPLAIFVPFWYRA